MGEWQAIETAVSAALAGLTGSGGPLLATVRGRTAVDRKVLVAGLLRERLPAAYVMLGRRDTGDKEYRQAGPVMLTVLFASRSERCEQDARLGGAGVTGVTTLAESAATALRGLDLDGHRRLMLVDERPAGGDEATALWEQRYEVRPRPGDYVPLFNGYPLIGASSVVEVHVGELKRAASTFAFPGVDGVFERFAGTRERPIVWRGQLRAGDNAALNMIEQGLEDLVREGRPGMVFDPWARTFGDCVVSAFKRVGPRTRDDLTGQALQNFELEFIQLL